MATIVGDGGLSLDTGSMTKGEGRDGDDSVKSDEEAALLRAGREGETFEGL